MLGSIQDNKEQLFPGFELKTGDLDYVVVNANPGIIPLTLYVTYSQVASTQWAYVKYGDSNLLSTRQYEGTASAFLSTGTDGFNMIKKSISLINIGNCRVKTWLEQKTNPFPNYEIRNGSYSWSGDLPSNMIPLSVNISFGGTQWTEFPSTVYFKDNLGTVWQSCYVQPASSGGSGSWSGAIDLLGLYNGDLERLKSVDRCYAEGSQSPWGNATLTIWLEQK